MSNPDHDVLRSLASRWMAQATRPVMAERRRQWTALKDLHAERPMVLFETWTLEDYVTDDELACADPNCARRERHARACAPRGGDRRRHRGRAVLLRLLAHHRHRLRRGPGAGAPHGRGGWERRLHLRLSPAHAR